MPIPGALPAGRNEDRALPLTQCAPLGLHGSAGASSHQFQCPRHDSFQPWVTPRVEIQIRFRAEDPVHEARLELLSENLAVDNQEKPVLSMIALNRFKRISHGTTGGSKN